MAAIQGRAGELWAETGAAVVFTAEACTLVSGTIYKITNATKRQWDPATAVLVYVNAVLQTSGYHLHAPVGQIHFDAAQTLPITVSGKYFPTAKVGLVTDWELNIESNVFDVTALGDTAKMFVGDGVPEFSGSFSRFYEDNHWAALQAGNNDPDLGDALVLKLYEDKANSQGWAGYATMKNWSVTVPIEIIKESIQFSGDGEFFYFASET